MVPRKRDSAYKCFCGGVHEWFAALIGAIDARDASLHARFETTAQPPQPGDQQPLRTGSAGMSVIGTAECGGASSCSLLCQAGAARAVRSAAAGGGAAGGGCGGGRELSMALIKVAGWPGRRVEGPAAQGGGRALPVCVRRLSGAGACFPALITAQGVGEWRCTQNTEPEGKRYELYSRAKGWIPHTAQAAPPSGGAVATATGPPGNTVHVHVAWAPHA